MPDNKKYYYLKLKENFFDNDEMIILESMQDGYLYSNILLKLYLRSLKYSGRLMFNDRIPFNSTMLAQVTRHNVGVVEKAMGLFADLGLIEVMESGAIYVMDIQNFIGSSSSEADRQREYQHKLSLEKESCKESCKKSNKISNSIPNMESCKKSNSIPTPEIELEIEIKTELEKKTKNGEKKTKNDFLKFWGEEVYEQFTKKYKIDDLDTARADAKFDKVYNAIITKDIKNPESYIKAVVLRVVDELKVAYV